MDLMGRSRWQDGPSWEWFPLTRNFLALDHAVRLNTLDVQRGIHKLLVRAGSHDLPCPWSNQLSNPPRSTSPVKPVFGCPQVTPHWWPPSGCHTIESQCKSHLKAAPRSCREHLDVGCWLNRRESSLSKYVYIYNHLRIFTGLNERQMKTSPGNWIEPTTDIYIYVLCFQRLLQLHVSAEV